jgi:hypothetical protein
VQGLLKNVQIYLPVFSCNLATPSPPEAEHFHFWCKIMLTVVAWRNIDILAVVFWREIKHDRRSEGISLMTIAARREVKYKRRH